MSRVLYIVCVSSVLLGLVGCNGAEVGSRADPLFINTTNVGVEVLVGNEPVVVERKGADGKYAMYPLYVAPGARAQGNVGQYRYLRQLPITLVLVHPETFGPIRTINVRVDNPHSPYDRDFDSLLYGEVIAPIVISKEWVRSRTGIEVGDFVPLQQFKGPEVNPAHRPTKRPTANYEVYQLGAPYPEIRKRD